MGGRFILAPPFLWAHPVLSLGKRPPGKELIEIIVGGGKGPVSGEDLLVQCTLIARWALERRPRALAERGTHSVRGAGENQQRRQAGAHGAQRAPRGRSDGHRATRSAGSDA